jgi:lactoylglutathione lyase
MHIEHVALYTSDLERMRSFYETYFQVSVGQKYTNPSKGFESYFLTFDTGSRLEIMQSTQLEFSTPLSKPGRPFPGYAHLAISLGSKDMVDNLTSRLRQDGYTVVTEPRTTGDGYYESVVLDPDGNLVELAV